MMDSGPTSICIDEGLSRITIDGRTIALTATEMAIIAFLGRHPLWRRTRQEILMAVDPHVQRDIYERAIDSHIKRMRAKGVNCIGVVYGIGYIWSGPAPVFTAQADRIQAQMAASGDVILTWGDGLSMADCLAAIASASIRSEQDGLQLVSVQILRATDLDQAQGLAVLRPTKCKI